MRRGLPPEKELCKDVAFPVLDAHVKELSRLWQVFYDDLDSIEVIMHTWRDSARSTYCDDSILFLHALARVPYQEWHAPCRELKASVRMTRGMRLGMYSMGAPGGSRIR